MSLAAIAGCAVGPATPPGEPGNLGRSVEVEHTQVVLRDGGERRALTTIDEADGTPVHAALRPGDHEEHTVLVLTRVARATDGRPDERYELHYFVATDDAASELYGFPEQLQVAEEAPDILDVPPVPVWSPAGDAIAWIEWVEAGTRLRTVGWTDDGETHEPSGETAAYALDAIPAGVQLEDWQTDVGGDPVLLARQDDQPYRIQLALGQQSPELTSDLSSDPTPDVSSDPTPDVSSDLTSDR